MGRVKPPPLAVALLAMLTSLVTVSAIELWRCPAPATGAAWVPQPLLERTVPLRSPAGEPVSDSASIPSRAQTTFAEARLIALEQRLAQLEQSLSAQRLPAAPTLTEPEREEELRQRVLDWIEQEREARRQAEQSRKEQEGSKQRDFDTRYSAHILALEHDLAEWEEEQLAKVLLEIEIRREEIEGLIDPLTDDPKEVEQRFVEFDQWSEQRLLGELGQELYERLFSED